MHTKHGGLETSSHICVEVQHWCWDHVENLSIQLNTSLLSDIIHFLAVQNYYLVENTPSQMFWESHLHLKILYSFFQPLGGKNLSPVTTVITSKETYAMGTECFELTGPLAFRSGWRLLGSAPAWVCLGRLCASGDICIMRCPGSGGGVHLLLLATCWAYVEVAESELPISHPPLELQATPKM